MTEPRFQNTIGSEYDLFRVVSPHHDFFQDRTAKFFNLDGMTWTWDCIEIGYGTGITTEKILSASPTIRVLAVDNSPNMHLRALTRLETFNAERYMLFTADALDFLKVIPSNSVENVVSVWTLHNINREHRLKIYTEILRVLKPGGVFINSDKIVDTDLKVRQKDLDDQIRVFSLFSDRGRPDLEQEWTAHYLRDAEPDLILIDDEYRQNLTEIGFVEYEEVWRSGMDRITTASKPD